MNSTPRGNARRFAIEAFLAIEFGDHAVDLIRQHGLEVLGGVALVALVWLGYRAFWARREAAVGE